MTAKFKYACGLTHMTLEVSVLVRRSLACVVFAWAMSVASASANPILFIDPSTTAVNVNDTFTVNIAIAGVTDLFSYNFDLGFDPEILSFLSIAEGDFFPHQPPCDEAFTPPCEIPFFIPGEELIPGTVSFTGDAVTVVDQNVGVNDDGILAVATFRAIMAGTSSIALSNWLFLDSTLDDQNPIGFSAVNTGSVQVNGVATVPDEPSTMVVLIAALALAGYRSFTQPS
jgi:hypothetical protein